MIVHHFGQADELHERPLFVVWRAAPGLPPSWMPRGMEGRWDHRMSQPPMTLHPPPREGEGYAVVIKTNRIEHRDDDGASAEVWELHPPGGNYDDDPANRLPLW